MRVIDVKIGHKTAQAGWAGKSRSSALRNSAIDGMTNTHAEGFRLEGFDNPPPALTSVRPLLERCKVPSRTSHKALLRFSLQVKGIGRNPRSIPDTVAATTHVLSHTHTLTPTQTRKQSQVYTRIHMYTQQHHSAPRPTRTNTHNTHNAYTKHTHTVPLIKYVLPTLATTGETAVSVSEYVRPVLVVTCEEAAPVIKTL